MNTQIRFLTFEEIQVLHDQQIDKYGGSHGVRDFGLLQSAAMTPLSTFGGKYLYQDIFAMAGVYAYGIIKNHPFIDGNKRTGIASSLVFLRDNKIKLLFKKGELFSLGIAIATSQVSREEIADFFRTRIH